MGLARRRRSLLSHGWLVWASFLLVLQQLTDDAAGRITTTCSIAMVPPAAAPRHLGLRTGTHPSDLRLFVLVRQFRYDFHNRRPLFTPTAGLNVLFECSSTASRKIISGSPPNYCPTATPEILRGKTSCGHCCGDRPPWAYHRWNHLPATVGDSIPFLASRLHARPAHHSRSYPNAWCFTDSSMPSIPSPIGMTPTL